MDIQFYKSARDNAGTAIALQKVIAALTNDEKLKLLTFNIRLVFAKLQEAKIAGNETEIKAAQKQYDNAKKELPAVTWSGTFTKRKADQLAQHSGIICIDVDKLDSTQLAVLQRQLCANAHVFLLFVSPSGVGLKILFKIAPDATQHLTYFRVIAQYLSTQYNIIVDESGKDVCRLCFLCHDANQHHNADAKVFELPKNIDHAEQAVLTPAEVTNFTNNYTNELDKIAAFTNNKQMLSTGNRNNWAYLFASNCNRKGVDISDCLTHVSSLMPDKDITEISATVQSAYTHHAAEFGKFQPQQKTAGSPKKQHISAPPPPTDNNEEETENEDYANSGNFWNTTINDKTGKETVSLNYTRFYNFLETEGFANLKIDNQNVELIHIKNNIVTPVIISNTRNDVKMYMNDYCKKQYKYKVLEMLHKGQDKYFARKQFINVGYKNVEFLKDNEHESFHFHSNCVVVCTKEGVTTRPYDLGEKALWASQINPRPFTLVERTQLFGETETDRRIVATDTKCEFAQYQILASCHPDAKVSVDVANKRFLAHSTAFGYLINSYKPSIGKAIVGADHEKAIDKTEQNGRTGKGILSKAIGFVTKRFAVDGRKFDPKDQAVFEGLTMDSKVITVDDCNERFDFGHFFVPITEDLTIRKLYLGYITIPYDMSPKWYFNTNFTFKGAGDSFAGRQHIIEFDNFFNKNYTPIHFFGHSLFRDWDDEQWNLFYNYAYQCDALHKLLGLVEYAEGNYMARKLTNECPQEFLDFVDAQDEQTGAFLNVSRNQWFDKKDFVAKWNAEARALNMQPASSKLIYTMLKKCCQSKSIGFYAKKSNGNEVYWIGEFNPHPLTDSIKCVLPAPQPHPVNINQIFNPQAKQFEAF